MKSRVSRTRGFILTEAVILVLVVGIVLAILAVSASEARRQASLGNDLANLRQLGAGYAAYGGDNADRVASFSWEPGIDYGFGGIAPNGTSAAANQAWHILRTRTGRPEWFGSTPPNWVPHILYSHLVLLDYLDTNLPHHSVVSPEDRIRLLWQQDPYEGFEALGENQRPVPIILANRRWPFSSSYELAPAFYSPDVTPTIEQGGGTDHNVYLTPTGTELGRRRLTEIAFPAQKVMMYDQYERHFGPRTAFFMYSDARVPLLLADGAATVRRTDTTNRGFYPGTPTAPGQLTRVAYRPAAWEPPTLSGEPAQLLTAHYRFTRSGLRGRDFGGPEVPWTE